MLLLDLARLDREGTLRVEGQITPDDPLWEGTSIRLQDPLCVELRATGARSGEIIVRGLIEGTLAQECRRCLDPVDVPFREEVTLVFAPPDPLGSGEDGEIRVLAAAEREVDLAGPIQEEVILAAPRWTMCDPECKGLCPHCGCDLNETTCECGAADPDPRWDALRALSNE